MYFEAFCAVMDINSKIQERKATVIDGDIVTDNEIDDADSIQRAEISFDPSLKALLWCQFSRYLFWLVKLFF